MYVGMCPYISIRFCLIGIRLFNNRSGGKKITIKTVVFVRVNVLETQKKLSMFLLPHSTFVM